MRKIITLITTAAMALSLAACSVSDSNGQKPFGVFLGASGEDAEKMTEYEVVVIEPETFDREQIDVLHDAGCFVYGYLDIGTLEVYRDYYELFEDEALDVYDDWPDERWMDCSSADWQGYITDVLAPSYLELGLDGFFLDNCDVYYMYPSDDMFYGMVGILRGLDEYDVKLMVNGGNDFVMRCVDEGISSGLIDAICQETVFTSIDFDNRTYGEQPVDESLYYQEYVESASEAGIEVYLIEYAAEGDVLERAEDYCEEWGFIVYNAAGLELVCE